MRGSVRFVSDNVCWLLGLVLLAGAGCRTVSSPELRRFDFQRPAMGTLFEITLYAPDESVARTASDAAFTRISALDAMMTDYDAESELMRLRGVPVGQTARVSEDLFEVLRASQRLAESSGGAFDVTIGPVVRQWRRARRMGELPSSAEMEKARASVGWNRLKIDERSRTVTLLEPGMQLDLGGIAKGFAADHALRVLKEHGVSRALVAASGDIAVGDAPPGKRGWRVSVGVPVVTADGVGTPGVPFARTLLLENAAVSTSGDAEQFVEIGGVRYSHIVDPKTGVGLTNRLQVSVVARRAAVSDPVATTVCVLGVERGLRFINSRRGLGAIILTKSPDGGWNVVESKTMEQIPGELSSGQHESSGGAGRRP
jgi:thiamine biosynthesis lipoprotein